MTSRAHIAIRGVVQGVGFRPFIYRLAQDLGLTGWVMNTPQGVFVETEGEQEAIDRFILRVGAEKPPLASIQSLESSFLDPVGFSTFDIRESSSEGEIRALVLPDIASCPECVAEVFDPRNRRHRYPFTNCTNCGPRFTIIESLPYDRPNISMKIFSMCDKCRKEYDNPADRRFHAQPIACPQCGPQLALWDAQGAVRAGRDEALLEAVRILRNGGIIALKGLGGFQLLVDAGNADAVALLRRRKRREEKPFALMVPDAGVAAALCEVSPLEKRLLQSPESPIVLLRKRPEMDGALGGICSLNSPVAPRNPNLGIMLPYTPLHHLLMHEIGTPIVATSGNLSDEPICIDELQALDRLRGIADAFLVHNRPIVRHADDSIARVLLGRELVLRRARGYSPLPIRTEYDTPELLAVGAHLKSVVAVARGRDAFISQHLGDLDTPQSLDAFGAAVRDLQSMFAIRPAAVAADMHPDYHSTRLAHSIALPVLPVQHHAAHIASCMAENSINGAVLGVSWDGTGYGTDGTVWGGEFLRTNGEEFSRVATFRRFRLPGGDRAAREPRRSALGLLYELYGTSALARADLAPVRAFTQRETFTLITMLERGVNAPLTSSAGRLFDAVASLVGLRQISNFEGQAAMDLEFALAGENVADSYRCELFTAVGGERDPHAPQWIADWSGVIADILRDLRAGTPIRRISARFHNALVELIIDVARRNGDGRVVLSGGCFQNAYLTERTVQRLREEGFLPYWHQRVPPNDGGIALGQIYAATLRSRREPA
ncbi:MAG: carbamoyltransferase HypF [Bacteroidota bacterium]